MTNTYKKPRVLIVHNYYQIPGGEDTVVANEKKLLEDNGHDVVTYVRNNCEMKNMSIFHKLILPFITIYNPKTVKEVKRIIANKHIDIVHVHNTLNLISPSIYYAAIRCKVPVVQTVHNFRLLCPGGTFYRNGDICEECAEHGLKCAIKNACYRRSRLQTIVCVISTKFHRYTGIYDKINYICLTEFNRDKIILLNKLEKKQIINPTNVFIKPNFVETCDKIIPFMNREKQFIFAGRLDKLKGIDILLKAWRLMNRKDYRLVICGVGPMEKWCRKYIDKNELGNVEMKGFISNLEVKKLIANSKALILPTQWYEGFPISILEAYSVGTPVVCSDLGNTGTLVLEGITGYKFKNDSVYELVQGLSKIIKNNDIYVSTYNEFKIRYEKDKNYKKLMEIYRICK